MSLRISVGALDVNATYEPTEEEAMDAAGSISNGCYKPTWCKPVQSVAIVIPYKNRLRHLTTLMYHLHPILQVRYVFYLKFIPCALHCIDGIVEPMSDDRWNIAWSRYSNQKIDLGE